MKLKVASSGAIASIKLVISDHIDNTELLCAALGVLNSFSTTDGNLPIISSKFIGV